MAAKNTKVTLKLLQEQLNDLTEELNVVKYEFKDVKQELNDVKKELSDTKETLKTLKVQGIVSDINKIQTQSIEGKSKQILKCKVCDKPFESRKTLKMHLIYDHEQKVKCNKCEETFERNCDLEEHIGTKHETTEKYDCDQCEKTFVLEWRRNKHREGHDTVIKKCHYYNNKKRCPFEKLGCMFGHMYSGPCKYGTRCSKKLCTFQHDQAEDDSDKNMKNYESDHRHSENNLVNKEMVEDEDDSEDDSEILETSTLEKYYPDCNDCAEKSNCVKCIIRNIRETDM